MKALRWCGQSLTWADALQRGWAYAAWLDTSCRGEWERLPAVAPATMSITRLLSLWIDSKRVRTSWSTWLWRGRRGPTGWLVIEGVRGPLGGIHEGRYRGRWNTGGEDAGHCPDHLKLKW